MTTPNESHIKAAIIGMWRQGATPEQIEFQLGGDLFWSLSASVVTINQYIKEVIAKYKPKK